MGVRSCLQWLAAACVLVVGASAQLPIPGKPPGFTLGGGRADAGVQIESYIDLLCPDSKAAYPGLKKLTQRYKPHELRVQFVLFPLPYHQHAFAAAEAAFTITSALGDDQFTDWLETIYANQDLYWNKATKDLTPLQVVNKLKALAQHTFPKLSDEQWAKGMTGYGGTEADDLTRVSWKYACSRGASGTPLYRLNGVPFDADATWGEDEWVKVVDPLVKANQPKELAFDAATTTTLSHAGRLSGVPAVPDRRVTNLPSPGDWEAAARICAADAQDWARPCEFVPGRAMCCQANEACVLRTGCVALA